MTRLFKLLTVSAASAAIAVSGCAHSQDSLDVMDGLLIGIDERAFKKIHPEAIDLSDSRYSSSSGFVYFPTQETKYFGHRVAGYSRGFENGRGCMSGVTLEKLSRDDISILKTRVSETVNGVVHPEYRAGNDQSLIGRYSGEKLRVTVAVKANDGNEAIYSVSVSVSLTTCDERLAKSLWKTLPK
jgi:hypothetical protein